MKSPRKRPLILSTKKAGPILTSTTRRLQKLLDEGHSKKKRLLSTRKQAWERAPKYCQELPSAIKNPKQPSKESVRSSFPATIIPQFITAAARPADALAFRGGLDCIPSLSTRPAKDSNPLAIGKISRKPPHSKQSSSSSLSRLKRQGLVKEYSDRNLESNISIAMPHSAQSNVPDADETSAVTTQTSKQEQSSADHEYANMSSTVDPTLRNGTQNPEHQLSPHVTEANKEGMSKPKLGLAIHKKKLATRHISYANVQEHSLLQTSAISQVLDLPSPTSKSKQPNIDADSNDHMPLNDSVGSAGISQHEDFSLRVTGIPPDRIHPLKPTPKRRKLNNDNFVRLNLRNSAGACRGARNKKFQRRRKDSASSGHGNTDGSVTMDDEQYKSKSNVVNESISQGQTYASRLTGVDPLDDFQDGVFHSRDNGSNKKKNNSTQKDSNATLKADSSTPKCTRHGRPCKLVEVKKNTRGNKGRKFYACSMPWGEQCDHFEWAEDTHHEISKILSENNSHSSFIARQVAAHVDRFRILTVPELKKEAARHKLNTNGKKSQLLMRLAVWVRDELVNAVPDPSSDTDPIPGESEDQEISSSFELDIGDDDSDSDDDSTSSEELDLVVDDTEALGRTTYLGADKPINSIGASSQLDFKLCATLQSVFGHSKFREGQLWAIKRCLAGEKSLLVAPTGFGKSLCYALPATLMDGICVVVSPLISLMQDQLRSLPPRVPAATLSGALSVSASAAILDDVIRDRLKILFVSPERLASPSFRRLFNLRWNPESQQYERKFPKISLLCIDEAHCVSQWAHNFRPCFLRFRTLLQKMNPQSILAVTATAGSRVIEDICQTIGVPKRGTEEVGKTSSDFSYSENVFVINRPRDNLDVVCKYVSNDEERLDLVSKVLKCKTNAAGENNFTGVLAEGAVIVYVWRQRDCEVLAEYLVSSGVSGGVVIYHGGMDAAARGKAQSKFMRGKARICVATVAFGMGIDKADVVGVVHAYLSSSPEHYLQEIGRAGRDGRHAIAISLPTAEEVPVRHSLVHSNFISPSQIRTLLLVLRQMVLESLPEGKFQNLNIALPVQSLVIACDCKAETIETILSILEQNGGDVAFVHLEGFNYDSATIALKKRSLDKLASIEDVAKCIKLVGTCCEPPIGEGEDQSHQALHVPEQFQRHFIAYSNGSYTFSVAQCANALGPTAEPRHVFAALRRLQASGELELALDTSSNGRVFSLKVTERGIEYFTSTRFDEEVDNLTAELHKAFSSSIESGACKVLDINFIMQSVAEATKEKSTDEEVSPSLQRFHDLMATYFGTGFDSKEVEALHRSNYEHSFQMPLNELENDVFGLLHDLPLLTQKATLLVDAPIVGDSNFADYTAVATAKFLHGLDSPRAPLQHFKTHPLFGKWRRTQFSLVLDAINKLIHKPEC